ncbi:MAG: hypothetical protein HZY74_08560 [Brevundimonas sp.]|nr:MAG: hypothetical protein HZY74_08560 [Brevundimonas sp.]
MNNLNQVASETRGGTTRTNSWNPNGNLAGDGDRTYSWTFGNRMSGATGGGQTASYTYDSEDRRAAKTVNGDDPDLVVRQRGDRPDERGGHPHPLYHPRWQRGHGCTAGDP